MTATKPRPTLTLVTGGARATVTAITPPAKPTAPTPTASPVRDAALEAVLEPDALQAMDDAIETVLEHLARDNGATPIAGLLKDVWRAAFATGYQAAHDGQARADFADDTLAKVITLEARERAELPAKERALRAVRP